MKPIQIDDTRLQAERTLTHINQLKECPAYGAYLVPRLKARREELAQKVLDDEKLTPEERERVRAQYKEARDVLKVVDNDQAGATKVVNAPRGK